MHDMTLNAQQFWIGRELKKVRDEKRRTFLHRMFSGEAGWRRFLTLMRTRKGADEFRTGVWEAKLPKYTRNELEQKRPTCIFGCGFILPPQFTPWGELFEDFIPICPKCLLKIKNKTTKTMQNQNSENGSTTQVEVNPASEQADSSCTSGVTLEDMVAQFPNLKPSGRIQLGERILKETRENLKRELADLEAKMKELRGYIGQDGTVAETGTIKRRVGRPPKAKNNSDAD